MSDFVAVLADSTPWVHDLSPFLVRFTDSFGIRWYGFAYVLGFFFAYLLLRQLVRRGCSELREDQVADFITFAALFGVMLGGRLGYMFLYNWEEFSQRPWIFFQFLKGGMASHGGILGLVIFTWVYARITKLSWPGLGDNLVVVSSIGIFLVRLANFVNGELYGRITESRIGIVFPRALHHESPVLITEALDRFHATSIEHLVEMARTSESVQVYLAGMLSARHPSQLYEAVLEGLLLFLVLLAVRLKWKNLYHGVLTGLFFLLYAAGRIFVENFREPDAEQIAGLTRGQFYSTFMILVGLGFLAYGFTAKRQNRTPPPKKPG